MKKPYHYTECGLDYVYLLDGFETIKTAYGRAVRVASAGKLDRAIARIVVRDQNRLTGQEVRFLRGLMDMTQAELGSALGKDAQTVARWEKGKTEIPPTEDIAIRQIYLEETGHRQRFIDTSRRVADLRVRVGDVTFKVKGRRDWTLAA
ncbi:MAG TPA: helix-turn-helix domain-containing protein [Dongiaceae bacterium]|nr:helix-turn-helix domain-containing protein [Dongiaceae bacterium]